MSEIWSTWGLALPRDEEETVVAIAPSREYQLVTDHAVTTVKVEVGTYTSPSRALDAEEKAYLVSLGEGGAKDRKLELVIARRCLPSPENLIGEKPTKWYELRP